MKPPQQRRWVKRGLFALLTVFVLMVVAHRPLLRVAVNWAGQHYAAKNGYQLEWQVSGSIISDLSVSDGRLIGESGARIKMLEWRKASFDYSLWGLLTKGLAEGAHRVALKDVSIEVDARPRTDVPNKKASPALPDIWLQSLDLQNINARVITGEGDVVLEEFTLLLDDTKPGTVSLDALALPAAGLQFRDVRGGAEFHERKVTLLNLVISPDVKVPSFALDLENVRTGTLPFELAVQSGQGSIECSGRVDDLMTRPVIDLKLSIIDLAHTEIARWVQIPKKLSWVIDSAVGQVSGVLADPLRLRAELALTVSDIGAADMHFVRLAGRASMINGAVKIETLEVQMNDRNRAMITGEIDLVDQQNVALIWSAHIGDFASLSWPPSVFEEHVDVKTLVADGAVSFDMVDVTRGDFNEIRSQGTAEIEELNWRQRRLEKASIEFRVDQGLASISKLDLRFDAENEGSITGDVRIGERHAFNLQWQMRLLNLAKIAPWFSVGEMTLPSAGAMTFAGNSSGEVADLRAQNYKRLEAEGIGSMTGIVWQNARLEEAAWDISSHNGRLDVKKLEVRLNELNVLKATGHLMLVSPGDFEANVSASFDQLADFSGWLELAKQPRINSGRASLSWGGSGNIAERAVEGAGSLIVNDLRIEGRTEVVALVLETRHAGRRAEITKFQASTGKIRAEASMVITDTDLKIPQLVLFSGQTRLIDGFADLPLALAQTPRPALPLDRDRPLKVNLQIAKVKVQNLLTVLGQNSHVTGYAAVDLQLNGTLSNLSGQLSATLTEMQAVTMKGKLEPALVKLDAVLDQHLLTVKASAKQKPLQTLTLNAELPMDAAKLIADPGSIMDTVLAAHAVLPSSDLSVILRFVPALSAISGKASVDARISGTLRKPDWQGRLLADAESATIKGSDIDIRDLKVRGTFSGQRFVFDEVSTLVSGGEMSIAGGVDLTHVTDPKLDLKLAAKQALLFRNDTMSLRADGSLTCTGSLTKADVAGRMELVRGRVYKEIEFLPLSFPDQLPPRLASVNTVSGRPSAPLLFADWNLNVDIVTSEPIRLLGNVLNGRAAADLHLSGTGAVPVLEGKISQQGARVKLPFSRLELTRGDIVFTKERPFDPQLDLQGDATVENTQVTVYATGAAAKPTLRFTSSPPLSEPEIATLLATGTTAGDAQSAGGVAANRAAFLVLSKAYRKVFGKHKAGRMDEDDVPGRTSFSFNPLSSQTSASNLSGKYEITPNLQAEVGLGERGFRGMLSYLIRIR
jgi:hypothetical protein